MNTNSTLKIGFKLIAGTVMAVLMSMSAMATETDYEAGVADASTYQYAQALSHFQAAAAQGNREALRTAALMLLYGERLYGSEIHANRSQAVKLFTLAADQGCEVSALMLKRLQAGTGSRVAMLSAPTSAQ